MNSFAALEAEAHGAIFLPGEVERGFEKEEKALESWEEKKVTNASLNLARKRWRAVIQRKEPGEWTHGQAYVRLWQEGQRPDYTTMIGSEVSEADHPEFTDHAPESTSGVWSG